MGIIIAAKVLFLKIDPEEILDGSEKDYTVGVSVNPVNGVSGNRGRMKMKSEKLWPELTFSWRCIYIRNWLNTLLFWRVSGIIDTL